MWTLLVIYILLCIFGLFNKRNIFIYILLVGICIIISGFNTDNPDFVAYSNRYNWANYPKEISIHSVLDISYIALQAFCKDIGISTYEEFRLLLSIIIYSTLAILVYRYCIYYNLFYIIFIFAYLPLDLIQIRNFFAFIVLLPFLLSLNHPSTKKCIKYLISVLVAFTIHFSCIFFAIFGFIGIKRQQSKYVIIFLACVTVTIFLPFVTSIVKSSAAVEHISEYSKPSIIGGIFQSSFLVVNYFLINNILKEYSTYSINNNSTVQYHKLRYSFIKNLNLLLLFLIPLIFMNGTATRIFRFISLINIMYIINLIYKTRNNPINKLSIYIILILYFLFFGIYYIYMDEQVVNSIFKNSILQ